MMVSLSAFTSGRLDAFGQCVVSTWTRVGTSRCDVPARVERAERKPQHERTRANVEISAGRATVSSPRRWDWCTNPLGWRAEDSRPYLKAMTVAQPAVSTGHSGKEDLA